MKGIIFQSTTNKETALVNRTDIVMFVGFVRSRNKALSTEIKKWLTHGGFSTDPGLINVPVPIVSWEEFDDLFMWENRDSGVTISENKDTVIETYLGASVRAFFSQGGRQCYVVSVGDPAIYNDERSVKLAAIEKLLPGYPDLVQVHVSDRKSWKGVGLLYALPEVSFISLPDLPELVSSKPVFPTIDAPLIQHPPEQFVECSAPVSLIGNDDLSDYIKAPRCNDEDYDDWNKALVSLIDFLRNPKLGRATHLIAAVPLPNEGEEADKDLLAFFVTKNYLSDSTSMSTLENRSNISSAFVQLVYPWLVYENSSVPENIENPEGYLLGLLANNALSKNTFRTVSNYALSKINQVYPVLRQDQIYKEIENTSVFHNRYFSLTDRFTLFEKTYNGVRLLTDVSTSQDINYQSAGVCRLVSMLVRACRLIGDELVFESSGENLWSTIENRLTQYLDILYEKGAFRGKNSREAFDVTCNRNTMTQNQIDKGIVIAHVRFEAVASIESITISLSLTENGQVGIVKPENEKAA